MRPRAVNRVYARAIKLFCEVAMGRLLLLATTALAGYACWRSGRNEPLLTQPDRLHSCGREMQPTSLK